MLHLLGGTEYLFGFDRDAHAIDMTGQQLQAEPSLQLVDLASQDIDGEPKGL